VIEVDEIVQEFLVESNENLDQMDRDLVALEKEPTSREILARVFRAIHTIKGTTGFLGFPKLEAVAHAGEGLLSRLRDGALTLNPEITSFLLALVDAVREMLLSIEASGQDGVVDYTVLIDRLTRLQNASPPEPKPPLPAAESVQPQAGPAATVAKPASPKKKRAKARPRNPVESQAEVPNEAKPAETPEPKPFGEILVEAGRVTPEQVADAIGRQIEGDPRHLGEILVEQGAVQPAAVLEALQAQKDSGASALSANNIRVDVGQLDKLMNLVGELVLARNQILQFSAGHQDASFLNAAQRLNQITTELQEGVMKTRLQPIDNIWNRFPRVVRDLAMSCGKRIRVEMEGKETELDKTIIEAIKDPLTHIVRNSVDHGVEGPEERVTAGKPAEGRLFLRAYHEGGQVNIEISDDGAGIAVDRVKRKAVERGLITAEQAARMSEREALNLVFLPGLSTAEKVTNVSGRGVGMDVVKTNIEKIGGLVDVQSKPGLGTTIKIKIPLTLAIIPALIVTSTGDRFAIPQVSLLELVRVEGDDARHRIEFIHGAAVYRLRGNLLPLLYLNHELGLKDDRAAAGRIEVLQCRAENSAANIVVLRAGERPFGLVVDAVNDTAEIVVKPLGQHLKGIPTFAGATILGDGKVALILDVLGLAHRANLLSESPERGLEEARSSRAGDDSEKRSPLLLFRSGDQGRMAIPLSLVTRLEEFPRTAVERTGDQEVVQYRDRILPLVRLSSLLPTGNDAPPGDEPVQVVVYSDGERRMGLIVEQVLDIVEENLAGLQAASRDGISGSLVIQGRVTEMVDLEGLIRTHTALRSTSRLIQETGAV